MKLMCKCGNIEVLKTDSKLEKFEIKNCDEGTLAVICKNCNNAILVDLNNK